MGVRLLRMSLVIFFLLSCGGSPVGELARPQLANTCSTQLPPRASPPGEGALVEAQPLARSLLVVETEFPLRRLLDTLEARAPKRVAEERDHDIGMAGRLQYTVDRGKFSAAVEGDALVVSVPLNAHVEACAKGRCYSSCAPEARVSTRVPLKLGNDERLHANDVRVDVTKGCTLRAGFLSVDVTPIIRGQVDQRRGQILAAIDRELPDVRPHANRLWSELEKPRLLPMGLCLVLAPENLVLGPASGTKSSARVRFGLYARPELRTACGEAPPPRKRPQLRYDAALPAEGEIHLAVMVNEQVIRDAFVSRTPSDLIEGRASVMGVKGSVARGLELGLGGELCGGVQVRASGATLTDPSHLALSGVVLAPGDPERLAGARALPDAFVGAVEKTPMLLPLRAEDVTAVLPELAKAMSDDTLGISATASDGATEGAFLGGDSLWVVMRRRAAGTLVTK